MRARRQDANHTEIKRAFEALGCSVLDLYTVGGGCPDLLVGAGRVNILVEVKTAKGTYTNAQKEFNLTWRGRCETVRTMDDVQLVVKAIGEAMAAAKEIFTKSWKVMAQKEDGSGLEQISRPYHSLDAANAYAELAKKTGRQLVEVKTIEGYGLGGGFR